MNRLLRWLKKPIYNYNTPGYVDGEGPSPIEIIALIALIILISVLGSGLI